MNQNYHWLRSGRDTRLKEGIGSPPTSSFSAARTTWLSGLLLLVCCLFAGTSVMAQLAPTYEFSSSAGTFSSISSTGTNIAALAADNAQSNITGLAGFAVNGTTYTNARVSSNGWLILYGATAPTTSTEGSILSASVTNGAVTIAPMNADLHISTGGGTGFYYQTIGTENIFEWKNFSRYALGGGSDVLNFQIRMDTATGNISIVYGTCTQGSLTSGFQVGFKTNSATASNWATDINCRMLDVTGSPNSCDWTNTVTGNSNGSTVYFNTANPLVKPASGLTFTWTKPATTGQAPVRAFSAVTAITDNGATLAWTAPSGATSYNVQYRLAGSTCSWTNYVSNPVSATTLSLSGLLPNTSYQVRWQAINASAVTSIYSHTPNSTATAGANGYTATGTFTTLPLACAGTPSGGTVTSAASICSGGSAGVVLTATGYTTGFTGLSLQWEESDDNGVADAWANAVGGSGATTASYTTPVLTATRYYRFRVTCANGGAIAYSSNTSAVTVVACTFDVALQSSGASYTSIMPANGGTGNTYPGWQSATSGDDNTSTTVSLAGTTFKYQGNTVAGFQACTNGWMTFNTANTSVQWTNDLTSSGQTMLLAPFWDDLVVTGQAFANLNGSMRYQVSGTLGSGSAVITVEWAGMERFNIPGPNLNFQVKLYESDNHIEFIYGNFEGFDGTFNDTYSYSTGYNSAAPGTNNPINRFMMQTAFTNHFGSASSSSNVVMPTCFSKFTLTPGTYTGPATAPTIPAPANDNRATAQSLTVNSAPCTSYCGTYYTSRSATNSGFGASTCGTTAGNEDDDVWFSFTTTAATDYVIRLRNSPSYDGVLQLIAPDGTTSITCANATGPGLMETINATALTAGTYYIRVYHNAVGIGGSGQFALCVSEVINPPANDNICGAVSLTATPTCTETNSPYPSILAATASPQTSCAGSPTADVWYSFVAVTSGDTVTVDGGAGYNPHVQVFSSSDNSCTGTLTSVSCVNATSTGGIEVVTGSGLVPGNTYFVRVYHSGGGSASGLFTICATATAPPCITNPTYPTNGGNVCEGVSSTLTWPAASGASGYTVVLDGVTVSTNQAGLSYNAGVLATGSHSWSVSPLNVVGTATACTTWTFSTTAPPTIGTISGPVQIPLGQYQDFTETGGTGGALNWQYSAVSGGPYTVISGTTDTNPVALGSDTATTFYITATRTLNGCVATSNELLVVIAPLTCPENLGPGVVNVSSLPYNTTAQTTCGSGDNVTSTNVACVAGSTSYYGGEDRTYIFTPATTGNYDILLTTDTDDDAGIMLYSGCPFTSGSTCVANSQGTSGLTRTLTNTSLTGGVTYYLVVDNFPAPACIAGYSLSIEASPTCGKPTGLAVTDIKATTVDIAWVSSTIGTGATYDWEIRTTADVVVTSGSTTAPTVSVNDVPGLTPATAYRLYVRTNCTGTDGASSFGGPANFTTLATCGAPTALTVSDFTLTSVDLAWTAPTIGTAVNYNWEIRTSGAGGSGATGLVASGTSATTSVNDISGLTIDIPYSAYVSTDCSSGAGSSTWGGPTTFTLAAGESCATAATVPVAANEAAVVATLLTTGQTSDGPAGSCSDATGNPSKKDRWVKFVAPLSGNRVVIKAVAGTLTDAVMQVWDTCPAVAGNALGCNDDENTSLGLLMPKLDFCSLTPGATYYVQVWPYGSTTSGNFSISIYEDTACPTPPVNDNCAGAQTLTVGLDGTCATNEVSGTTVNSTASPGVVKTTCDSFSTYHDVFYKFNTGNNTALNLTFTNLTGTCEYGLYTACGATYSGFCNSGGGNSSLSGLTPNTDYYVIVWSNPGFDGTFTLCVSELPIVNSTDPTTLTSSAPSNTVCGSGSLTFTVAGGSLGTAASWKLYRGGCGTENGGTLVGTSATRTFTGIAVSSSATYYVRAEGTGNNTACASVAITVNALVTYYVDNDGDGFGSNIPGDSQTSCTDLTTLGYVTNNTDCDDSDSDIHAPFTPTVSIASSDADNTFCAGSSVTFTATPSTLSGLNDGDYYGTGPVTVVYAFKVGATTVQTGSSNTYTTTTLTNGQSVSVTISVSGGTCRTTDTATSSSIPNTVTGVAEICWNGILENCSTVLSQGCAPVVVNMTPSYNNTTLTSLSQAIPAVSYSYGGYSNIKYRFSITNVTTGAVSQDIIQTSRFVNIPGAMHSYPGVYDIKVSAVINEEIVPFAGNTVRVSAPTVQVITLSTVSCGATLASLSSTLSANAGPNATGYTFRIRLNDANPTPTYATSQSATRFVGANSFTGFPLQYSSSYKVSVRYTYNDPVTGLPVESPYGGECTVNTPSIPTTTIASPACNTTVTSLNANMSAAAAPYATSYRFRIRLFADNGPTPTYYYTVPNASRFSSLNLFQGITLAYGTAYSIAAEYSVLSGSDTVWSGYGGECKVTTPFFPTTSLVASQCGQVAATSLTQQLNITPYPGFPNYKVKLEELSTVDEGIVASQEITVSYAYFKLNQFSIAQLGKNYQVSVAIKLNGVFGDFNSPPCDLHTAPVGKADMVVPFAATAYPNPFANNFMIDVKSSSQSNVSIKVYDMIGRMVEQRNVRVSDMESTTIGNNYPSGVYNVVVSQEDSVQTVRVVKR